MPPKTNLLTIGHSNHSLERFLTLLAPYGIKALADIRRFPGSRKHPPPQPGGPRRRLAEGGREIPPARSPGRSAAQAAGRTPQAG